MKILIFDAILFVLVGIPLALLWGRLVQKQKDKFKDEIRKEIINEMTTTTQAREPKPGSDAHYEAWRAEQLKKKESRE